MFLTCFGIGIWNHGPILVHIVIWANTAIFFSNVFKISHFLGYGHFGFQHFADTEIMVSVVDCVAAQVMSLGFSADFMWLNKLKTSEKARVFHTLMAYLWDAKILLFLCKKSLRMPFFSSQNALFNGKTVAIRVKICIVSSGLHSWDKILFEETFLFSEISSTCSELHTCIFCSWKGLICVNIEYLLPWLQSLNFQSSQTLFLKLVHMGFQVNYKIQPFWIMR